jgi:branched-chain amino acid transport system permease protein
VQALASIAVLASLYTLVATGYVLIYRASRVLNLAQGDLMVFGGYALFAAATQLAAPPVVAMALALATSVATGLLVYVLVMRRMAGHPVFAAVLVTVSIGMLLRVAVVLGYTDQIRYPAQALGLANPSIRLPGGALVMTSLFAFLRGSRLGIRMRAAGERPLLAAQRGINFQALFALSWALASLTGGLAGALYAENVRLDPSIGVIGLKAFAVALVGGLDSLGGVVPAALLIAAIEVLTVRYANPLLADVSPFICLLAMLLVRPWGIAGSREDLERV